MKNDNLGDRMKRYENCYRMYLPCRSPVIVRVDGRAFHTFTRGFDKPFDSLFMEAMQHTAGRLCEEIAGCKLAYVQSDEISLLITNNDTVNTQPWFDNNLLKIASLSASIATLAFNTYFAQHLPELPATLEFMPDDKQAMYLKRYNTYENKVNTATFDSRAFILPECEVANYFIWRQMDATRNSVNMVARSLYSHKALHGKNNTQLQDMIHEKGQNWNDYPTTCKRGTCFVRVPQEVNGVVRNKWVMDAEIPVFTKDRGYIERRFAHGDLSEQQAG